MLTIDLKRGWGCYVLAVDESETPIAGVHILLDSVQAGVTAASELLTIEHTSCPGKFEICAPGWRVLAAPFVDEEGTLVAGSRRSCSTYRIQLARE